MPIKFDIVDNRVLVKAADLEAKEMLAIWNADTTAHKEHASAHLAFIKQFCDLDGTFSDVDFREKERIVKGNVYNDSEYKHDKKWLPLINAGLAAFMRYNQTAERRLLPTYKNKVDQLRTAIDDANITLFDSYVPDPEDPEGGKMVKVKATAEIIMGLMTSVDKVLITQANIEARIMKKGESRNKADVEESLLEQGLLGIKPLTNAN